MASTEGTKKKVSLIMYRGTGKISHPIVVVIIKLRSNIGTPLN
mgnify:CR=1 FL=1